jgi:hypothetical protein
VVPLPVINLLPPNTKKILRFPNLQTANITDEKTQTNYRIVSGCIPLNISANECGSNSDVNLLVTVVREDYGSSPLIKRFNNIIIQPDINRFFLSFSGVFLGLFII